MAKHTYPSRYPKGSHWATDLGWKILDQIEPGAIPDDTRMLLAGQIAGLAVRMESDPSYFKRRWEEEHGSSSESNPG